MRTHIYWYGIAPLVRPTTYRYFRYAFLSCCSTVPLSSPPPLGCGCHYFVLQDSSNQALEDGGCKLELLAVNEDGTPAMEAEIEIAMFGNTLST